MSRLRHDAEGERKVERGPRDVEEVDLVTTEARGKAVGKSFLSTEDASWLPELLRLAADGVLSMREKLFFEKSEKEECVPAECSFLL